MEKVSTAPSSRPLASSLSIGEILDWAISDAKDVESVKSRSAGRASGSVCESIRRTPLEVSVSNF